MDWLAGFGRLFSEMLTEDGSVVVELGNAWEPGQAVMSTLALEALLDLVKAEPFHLCPQFICYNPSRLPTPVQWVNIERIRVKDAYTNVWWMSPVEKPEANNRRVLKAYSGAMLKLLASGKYNGGRRPSQHLIGRSSFLRDNSGAIPSNVLTLANTKATDTYLDHCKEHGQPGSATDGPSARRARAQRGSLTRAAQLRVLKEVALIACEDTRRTRILLTHFGIHAPVTSYFEHNKRLKGRPPARDPPGRPVRRPRDRRGHARHLPGFPLVKQAREAGVPVVPVPGPSAVAAALSAAGVPADRFVFDGFLPVKPGRRIHRLEALRDLEMTVVCYESPHRILGALDAIARVFGEREIVVAREMTKQFKEIVRGPAAGLRERFGAGTVRGEFTLVIPSARFD
jgi:hypothetical protein